MTKNMLEYLRKELKRKFVSVNNFITDEMAQSYREKLRKNRQLLSEISGLSQDKYEEYFRKKNSEALKVEMQEIDNAVAEYQDCIDLLYSKEHNLEISMINAIHETTQSFIKAQYDKISKKGFLLNVYSEKNDCCASVSVVRASAEKSIEILELELARYEKDKPIVEKAFRDIDSMFATVETDD